MNNKQFYWDTLLAEVLNRKNQIRENSVCNTNAGKNKYLDNQTRRKNKPVRYYLGDAYKDITFSKREAECMIYFIKGKTIAGVAAILNLSPRTVEFYANNMKKKLKCKTKSELIGKVLNTSFINNIDFKCDN